MNKKLLFTLFACCFLALGFSQADCANALTLTPGTPQTGDTTGQAGSFSDSNTPPEVNPCSTNYNDLEYWFQYTAVTTGESLDITVSDLTSNYYGVFIIDNCPDSAPTCVAQDTNGFSSADLTVTTPALTAGVVYYIVLSDWIEGPTTFTMTSVVNAAPSCLDPTNLTATGITETAADLAWTEAGTATLWNIELGTDGFTPTGTPTASGVTNPYSAMSLSGGTVYDYYVQADCGIDGTSAWVGPFSFATPCANITPDYTADMSVNVPDSCWNEAGSGDPTTGPMNLGSSDWRQGTSYALGSSNAINLFSNTDSEWLLSPTFDLSSGGPFQLEVNVAVTNWNAGTVDDTMGSDDEVQLLMSTDNGTTWVNITTWNVANEPPVGGIEYIEDLTALTGNVMFAIWATDGTVNDSEDYDFHVGKFRVRAIPSCFEPTGLMTSNLTDTAVDLSWTPVGTETLWDIELVDITAAGTATGTPTTSGVANPYTLMGLTAENSYEVYVRADCSGSVSAWVGPISFTTACAPILAPYTETFETFTVATSAFNDENCWTGTNIGGYLWEVAATTDTSSSGTGPASGVSDGNYLFTEATSGSTGDAIDLISPFIDLSSLTAPSLSFDYHMFGADMGTLDVIVSTGGTETVAFTLSGQQQTADTDPFVTQVVDLSAYAGQTVRVIFRGTKGADFTSDMAVDTVVFDEAPSCFSPTAFMASNITDSTVDLSWVAGNTETSWDIELVDITATGSVTGIPTTSGITNPYTLMSLTSDNDYEVYLRADCGGGDFSNWVGPIAFTTKCAPIIPDYAADMSVNVPDSCWDEAGSGDPTTGPMNLGGSDWRQGTSYAYGPSNAINLYFNNDQEWLLSPTFDLSTGGPFQLDMNVAVTNWNAGTVDDTMGSDDEVQLLMSIDDGATWTNLTTWNAANEPPVGGIAYVEDLTAITGNVMFAIYATDGTIDDSEDYDFHIGRFEVRAIPSCLEPATVTNSVLTDTTADFTWVTGGTETTWEYANLPSPSSEPASGTSTMTTSAAFTGLTQNTDYDFYVRSDCGGTYSSWILISYTTLATPPANDLFADAIAISCGTDVSGTTIGATQDEADAPDVATVETDTFADNDSPWVWYSYTGTGDAEVITLSTCGVANTDFDTEIFVYTGTSGALTLIDDGYDECGGSAENFAAETTFTSDGTTTYYIAVGGWNASSIGNFQLSVGCTLGINDFENETAFTYYPNPVKNTLTLNAQNTIEQVSMFNMLGQEVLRATPNSLDSNLDMSNLQTGTYFVKVTIGNVTETIRVIKQ